MLAPISNGRRDKGSSFRRLKDYLTKERDPEKGEEIVRGELILSDNLLSLETADIEMRATASQNVLCKDPIYHYLLTWHPGERPSREQWQAAALRTMRDLGFAEHEFLIAAHDDKAHFHIHVMMNKVHPETYKAHTPYRDMFTLDQAMRELEHEQDWTEDVGLYRWDKVRGVAVKNTREEMRALSRRADRTKGKAAEMEHYRDEQSLQAYVKGKPAADLQMLLARHTVSWSDVHAMLCRHGLELQKADHGGYTVHALDSELYVKASDGFRRAFAGKLNRETTEKKLGPWQEPNPDDRNRGQQRGAYEKRLIRDPQQRTKRREEREAEREALKRRFGLYRSDCREQQKEFTASVRQRRTVLYEALRASKKEIREQAISWPEKRVQLSRVVAEHVVQTRLLKAKSMRERLEVGPSSYQEWVMREAEAGDQNAVAQLRGWRYQDQRLARQRERILGVSRNVVHLAPEASSEDSEWAPPILGDQLRALAHSEKLAKALATFSWEVDRRTGNVRYSMNGEAVLLDQGKAISVISGEEAAVVFALEMAVRKFGTGINATGSEAWKRTVAQIAARNEIAVKFTDHEMQRAFLEEQLRLSKPAGLQAQFSWLADSVTAQPYQPQRFCGRADTCAFVESLWPNGAGTRLLADLERSLAIGQTKRENLKGVCELVLTRSTEGQVAYSVIALRDQSFQLAELLTKAGQPTVRMPRVVRQTDHYRSQVQELGT